MSWNVITRDSLDLSEYTTLPFGRFNEALPFVSDFVNSSLSDSDMIEFNVSNSGALKRAIVKFSGIKLEMRTAKRDGTPLDKPIAIVDSKAVAKACAKLGLEINTHARKQNGKTTREFISLSRVATN